MDDEQAVRRRSCTSALGACRVVDMTGDLLAAKNFSYSPRKRGRKLTIGALRLFTSSATSKKFVP